MWLHLSFGTGTHWPTLSSSTTIGCGGCEGERSGAGRARSRAGASEGPAPRVAPPIPKVPSERSVASSRAPVDLRCAILRRVAPF